MLLHIRIEILSRVSLELWKLLKITQVLLLSHNLIDTWIKVSKLLWWSSDLLVLLKLLNIHLFRLASLLRILWLLILSSILAIQLLTLDLDDLSIPTILPIYRSLSHLGVLAYFELRLVHTSHINRFLLTTSLLLLAWIFFLVSILLVWHR